MNKDETGGHGAHMEMLGNTYKDLVRKSECTSTLTRPWSRWKGIPKLNFNRA
jgi:hypothetical protein